MSHIKLNYESSAQLFKTIAERHKGINSFVEVDLVEIKEVVRSSQQLPALVYSSFREGFAGEQADNNQSQKRIFFGIIDSYNPKVKNPRSIHQIIDDCRDLAVDVITYLRMLSRTNKLIGFSTNTVSDGDAIFEKDDGFFGWEFSIGINTPINLKFDPAKWEEEEAA